MRKRPTCVVPETTPRTRGTSVVRREMTPVAMLDSITNDRMPGTSSASSRAGPAGNRRSATSPTNEMATVAIPCATTIATSASVTPSGAAITIAASRSAAEPAWYTPRRSYRL